MAKTRCKFCHEYIDDAVLAEHVAAHLRLGPDGQQEEYVTLPPEQRAGGDLAGVPRVYLHERCGGETGMPEEIIRSYLADPFLYGDETFCAGCETHVPHSECTWVETGERLDHYFAKLQAAATARSANPAPPTANPSGRGCGGVFLLAAVALGALVLETLRWIAA